MGVYEGSRVADVLQTPALTTWLRRLAHQPGLSDFTTGPAGAAVAAGDGGAPLRQHARDVAAVSGAPAGSGESPA